MRKGLWAGGSGLFPGMMCSWDAAVQHAGFLVCNEASRVPMSYKLFPMQCQIIHKEQAKDHAALDPISQAFCVDKSAASGRMDTGISVLHAAMLAVGHSTPKRQSTPGITLLSSLLMRAKKVRRATNGAALSRCAIQGADCPPAT